MKRALCIWLPNWPLQRLAAARKEPERQAAEQTASPQTENSVDAAQAAVLYQLHHSGTARVVSYCPRLDCAAAALWDRRRPSGIRPGMPLAEAMTLVRGPDRQATSTSASAGDTKKPARGKAASTRAAEPSFLLELADPAADRAALVELAEWCQRFSPTVGLEEADPPESLLLDITGLGPLCGGEEALARQVARAFHQRGLAVRLAIADTLGAAWAVAHFADLEVAGDADDLLAIQAALHVPLVVPPDETRAALGPLPVEALRLPEATCDLLAELGLRQIEQVAALPRATLLARFGPSLLQRLDQAHGAAAEAIAARAVPAELDFDWPLLHPTDRREMIEFALDQLVARACAALAGQRRGMLRLECRFEHEQSPADHFVVGLYRPSASERHVGELVRLKLEPMRFRQAVSAIRLSVLSADGLEFRQREIFEDDPRFGGAAPRELAALVDRLSNRLGARAVSRPWLLAQAQPEFTCQLQPLAQLPQRRAKSRRPPPAPAPVDRPLHLEGRPRSLPVVSVAPEGPPMKFRLAGRDERIVRAWGPERIETGWWRARCVRRDYYQVETATGARYWLFRELNSGRWFLHGEFV